MQFCFQAEMGRGRVVWLGIGREVCPANSGTRLWIPGDTTGVQSGGTTRVKPGYSRGTTRVQLGWNPGYDQGTIGVKPGYDLQVVLVLVLQVGEIILHNWCKGLAASRIYVVNQQNVFLGKSRQYE